MEIILQQYGAFGIAAIIFIQMIDMKIAIREMQKDVGHLSNDLQILKMKGKRK